MTPNGGPPPDVGIIIPPGWTPIADEVELSEDLIVQFLNSDGTAGAPCELPAGSSMEHPRLAVRLFKVLPPAGRP